MSGYPTNQELGAASSSAKSCVPHYIEVCSASHNGLVKAPKVESEKVTKAMVPREKNLRVRKLSALVMFLALGALGTQAQLNPDRRGVEITPFGGSRFGGVIDLNSSSNVDYLTIHSTWDYGALLDVDLVPHAQAEFMWNHQPTFLSAHDFLTGTTSRIGQATLDMYHWSFLYELLQPGAKLQPYLVAGMGFTNYNTHGIVSLGNEFSYNLGGGVKYFFTRHVGLRLEARYSPSRTTEGTALFCDPFFGCFPAHVHNYAEQGQANLGLIFRF